jgi:hypothetical protein
LVITGRKQDIDIDKDIDKDIDTDIDKDKDIYAPLRAAYKYY